MPANRQAASTMRAVIRLVRLRRAARQLQARVDKWTRKALVRLNLLAPTKE